MDGLLIDTEPLWWQVETEVLNSIGIPLTKELHRTTMGMTMQDAITRYAAAHPNIEFDTNDVIEQIHAKMIETIEKVGQAMPGALDTIKICAAAGLKLAIASSSHPILIETVITRLGLSNIQTYC